MRVCLLMFALFLILGLSLFVSACGDDLDDDSGSADDDDDDDSSEFDDDDENRGGPDAPMIVGGYFNPDPVEHCDCSGNWKSVLFFNVCDPNGDLNFGSVRVFKTGTNEMPFGEPLSFSGFASGQAPTCDAPELVTFVLIFDSFVGMDDQFCVDVDVQDEAGNLSEKMEGVCVFVP
jgi:hypothetical protein